MTTPPEAPPLPKTSSLAAACGLVFPRPLTTTVSCPLPSEKLNEARRALEVSYNVWRAFVFGDLLPAESKERAFILACLGEAFFPLVALAGQAIGTPLPPPASSAVAKPKAGGTAARSATSQLDHLKAVLPVVFSADSQRVAHWMIRKYMLKPHHIRSNNNAVLRAAAATGSIRTLKWAAETLGATKQEFMICGTPREWVVCTTSSPIVLLANHPLKSSEVKSVVGVRVPKSLRTRPKEEVNSFILWLRERLSVTSHDLLEPIWVALDGLCTGIGLLATLMKRDNMSLVAALIDATGVTRKDILSNNLLSDACTGQGPEVISFLIDRFALDEYYTTSRTYELNQRLSSTMRAALLAGNQEAARVILQRFTLSRSAVTDSTRSYWARLAYQKGLLSAIKLCVEHNQLSAEEVECGIFPLIRCTEHTPQHDLIHAYLTETFHLKLPL